MGMLILLKNGAPTVTCSPVTSSENTGKSVPQNTAKHAASRMRLLNRKLASRDAYESSWLSLLRNSRRVSTR